MTKRFRIAVVDDHPLVRRGLAETFAEEPDFEIVGDGGSAGHAVLLARELNPDLITLDVSMPGGGIEAAISIIAENPKALLLMVSIREDMDIVKSALNAGARGYVSKGITGSDLIAVAHKILSGGRYVSPELAARLLASDAGFEDLAALDMPDT